MEPRRDDEKGSCAQSRSIHKKRAGVASWLWLHQQLVLMFVLGNNKTFGVPSSKNPSRRATRASVAPSRA